jgi:hypothetical protein
MFDFIFKLYARIMRAIMRATSTPTVASFMLPPLRGRVIGKNVDQDISPIMFSHYRVFDWNNDGMVLQTLENGTLWIDRDSMPEQVWFGVVDWILARQAQ